MRRWTTLVAAVGFVIACGTAGYAQTPSGSADKMGKDQMMEKKDDKKMGTDQMKMDKKQHDKMMEKDKTMEKKDDKMMDKKQ